jgi:hypothetical protein
MQDSLRCVGKSWRVSRTRFEDTEVQVDDVVRIVMFRKDGKNGI